MSRSPQSPTVVVLALLLFVCSSVVAGSGGEETGDVSRPVSVELVNPIYPQAASDVREDVEVLVAVKVLSDGSVGEAQVVHSRVPGMGFEQSALDAVSRWRFRPAEEGGEPVDSTAYITLNYRTPDPSYFTRGGGYSTLVSVPDYQALDALVRQRNETHSLQLPRRPTLRSSAALYQNAHIRGTRMVDKRKISKPQTLRDANYVRTPKNKSVTVKSKKRR
jgi:TonB family protein